MLQVFIVRPFGVKKGIDFDKVETDLIQPALAKLGLEGFPASNILEAGNIREDMFNLLLKADLVIADVSIHNANVFYELGIRHALRSKHTYLLRCNVDNYPFDLETDRYLEYDNNEPAACIDKLVFGLSDTIKGEHKRVDSPVFRLLPDLKEQDIEHFLAIPIKFKDDVEEAAKEKRAGSLLLFAREIKDLTWERAGLRLLGEQAFNLGSHDTGKKIWERVLQLSAKDKKAMERLSTIYQRLGDLNKSDFMLEKLLNAENLSVKQKVEAYALLGRNAKTRWLDEWKNTEDKAVNALSSSWLKEAYEAYEEGFYLDLNHYYSGLNALGLLTVMLDLIKHHRDEWLSDFETDVQAEAEETLLLKKFAELAIVVEKSILTAKSNASEHDMWLEISYADLQCLISENPRRVARLYRNELKNSLPFVKDSVRRQLLIYQQLGVCKENVKAALDLLPPVQTEKSITHVFLFTGHMIDAPDRETPRFPESQTEVAREAILDAVKKDMERVRSKHPEDVSISFFGLTGGACGGDLLFHDVCKELGIPTNMYLAFPREEFLDVSVRFAGLHWVTRFNEVFARLKPVERPVLSKTGDLPNWLHKKKDYNIWIRNNNWMLYNAIEKGKGNLTIFALWNGKGGDGPGGTKDMINQATADGAHPVVLDTNKIFNLT